MKCGETVVEMGSTQTEPAAAWNAAGAYAEGLRAERDAMQQKLDENAMPDDWIALTDERDALRAEVEGLSVSMRMKGASD